MNKLTEVSVKNGYNATCNHYHKSIYQLFLMLFIFLLTPSAQAKYSGGTGEPNNPYLISTAADMNEIGANPNDWDKHFVMVNDVNLADYTETQFNIIGTSSSSAFTGVFDGNNHSIINFTYYDDRWFELENIGLFGYVGDGNGVIKNLTLRDPNVYAYFFDNVGSLAGYVDRARIIDCAIIGGSITGSCNVGGLIGYIDSCRGFSNGIKHCSATAEVSGSERVGGLVGRNYYSDIINCYASGTVSGGDSVGGLVGYNYWYGNISNCYATGNVSGDTVGGLVGSSYCCTKIENCYATGDVSGSGDIGGLTGSNYSKIKKCYSVGKVSGSGYLGGLVGDNDGTITDSFWDMDTSERSNGVGSGSTEGLTGKTTEQMQTEATFTDAGWDFCGERINGLYDTWMIDEGVDYPAFFWQKRPGDFLPPDGLNFADYAFFANYWMENNCADSNNCDGTDLDLSGTVDSADLMIFANRWLGGVIAPHYSGGSGTVDDPYLIATAEDMNEIGLHPHEWDKHFLLVNDIDLADYTGTMYNIIGTDGDNAFDGVFDGNGHIIANFSYEANDFDDSAVGIFAWVYGPEAAIKDLHLTEPNITSSGWYVGSLVGFLLDGIISDCGVENGVVSGYRDVGGLIGSNYLGSVERCYATGRVFGELGFAGGLVGSNSSLIKDCYSAGDVTGDKFVGGLAGNNTTNDDGGIGAIKNCFSTADVNAIRYHAGGLVGCNWATITCSFASGYVDANKVAGGLVGMLVDGVLENCYASGGVSANSMVGGLVGGAKESIIEHCYAVGEVVGDVNVGGLIGAVYDSNNSFAKCFWDESVNPLLDGIGNAVDANVIAESTMQMKKENTFSDVGWDFVDIWDIGENQTYPFLRQYP